MSKKDYIAVADILSQSRTVMRTYDWEMLMSHFIILFKSDNANFDSARFKAACYA